MHRHLAAGLALGVLGTLSAAQARPADCLALIEERTSIEGSCGVQAEAGGGFAALRLAQAKPEAAPQGGLVTEWQRQVGDWT